MKIAMLQLNFWVGDFEGNTQKILDGYKKACGDGADLVVTSELAIFGYPPKDMLERADYLLKHDYHFEKLCSHVGDVGLVLGAPTRNIYGNGRPLYNSVVLVQNGYVTKSWRKALLPNDDVFDERRYFEPGQEWARTFDYKGKRIALLLCEDIWGGTENSSGNRLYVRDPIKELMLEQPEILIVPNGSPYYLGKATYRYDLVRTIAFQLHSGVCYVNQAGGNDDPVFDGRSFYVTKNGIVTAAAKPFEEEIVMADTDTSQRIMYPMDNGVVDLRDALVLSVRDYARKQRIPFTGAVVPLSGGIDSAVTACLAVDAFGRENVKGIALPCAPFSSEGSVADAHELAKNLGIEFDITPITEIYEAYGRVLEPVIGWFEPGTKHGDVTEENIQPRIRCAVTMSISNRKRDDGKNFLWIATGNKSEIFQGYWTLFGDTGLYALLCDVYKTQVYSLADLYQAIPRNTKTKPPSAELRKGQKDVDSLPPYDILDPILKAYVENGESRDEIIRLGFDAEIVRSVIARVNGSEFKRIFMPYGPKVSRKAVGSGRRWPIAAKFLE